MRVALLPGGAFSRYAPPALWATMLFALSSIPGDRYPEVRIVQFDKFVHFMMYMPLGIGLGRALTRNADRGLTWKGFWAATLLGSLYGASDEVHQLFVQNRSASGADWIIDCAAVAAGAFVWRHTVRWLSERSNKFSRAA